MGPIQALPSVDPSEEISPEREACDKAFMLACRYSGCRDLVEEMVAAKYCPLAKDRPPIRIENVLLPIFGEAVGVPFPRVDLKLVEGQTTMEFVSMIELMACEIIGDISLREYTARRAEASNMPRLNRVFEELGVHHAEHNVPPKVLHDYADKLKKEASKNATAATESKKRRQTNPVVKVPRKKRKAASQAMAAIQASLQ